MLGTLGHAKTKGGVGLQRKNTQAMLEYKIGTRPSADKKVRGELTKK